MAPFRRPQRDPPPPQLQQPQHHLQAIEDIDHLAGGEAPQRAQRHLAAGGRLQRNQVHQRRPNRTREEAAKVVVETLHTAERPEDEMDAQHNLSAESDSENEQEMQEELAGASASSVSTNRAQSKTKPTESASCQSETKPQKVNENLPKDEPSRGSGASKSPAERRPSQTDVQVSSF